MRARLPFRALMAPVPPVDLTATRAALAVLDCHRFTLDPQSGFARLARERGIARELAEYYEQVDQVVPNLRTLIEAWRGKGLPVIFTRLVADDQHAGSLSRQAGVTGFWTSPASPEAEFLPGVAPEHSDTLIDRTTVSAFAGTPLADRLRALETRSVVVAGVLAGGAVDLTAREAADLGYSVVVASDACAAETWTLHTLTTTMLVGALIRVRSVAAILEMLDGRRT
ncbi:MAG TPA: isochorismatase family cysteine hydrolase [bacterium]|nr:isochorismatase family cysteine hydrolase [bacterium]